MTQTDPPRSPLDALWQADEPPARDYAFTAATLTRMGAVNARAHVVRRALIGFGAGGAIAGVALMFEFVGADTWSMAVIGGAMTAALWAGGRLIAAG